MRRSANLIVKVVRIVKKLYFFGKIVDKDSQEIIQSLMQLFEDSLIIPGEQIKEDPMRGL